MPRTLLRTAASSAALCFLCAFSANSQSLPSKKDAAIILQKAAEAADLSTPDTPPFHLLADVHYELGSQTANGTYEMFWAAPDRYREHFKVEMDGNTAEETDVAVVDKRYVSRNTPTLSLPLWRVQLTLRSIRTRFFLDDKPKVHRVYSSNVDGVPRVCVEAGYEFEKNESCFNANGGAETTHRYPDTSNAAHNRGVTEAEMDLLHFGLSEFADLGTKRYPRYITRREYDEKLELKITVLEKAAAFDDDAFAALPGAMANEWCSDPADKRQLTLGSIPHIDEYPPAKEPVYYVRVGRDGRMMRSAILRSGGAVIDGQINEWLKSAQLGLKVCAGKPVEHEFILLPPIALHYRQY